MAAGTGLSELRWPQGLRYGLMALPLAFVALPLYVFLPNYYARSFGLPLASLGVLLLLARVADALDVAIGSALLSVRRLVFDADDHPVQWLEGLYRPDRYEYQLEVSRIGDVDARVSMRADKVKA